MEIRWSNPVLTARNLTNVQETHYKLVLTQNSDEVDQSMEFTWELLKFAPTYSLTQLNFVRPKEISAGSILDMITVYMDREIFMIQDVWGLYKNWEDPDLKDGNTTLSETQDQTKVRRQLRR